MYLLCWGEDHLRWRSAVMLEWTTIFNLFWRQNFFRFEFTSSTWVASWSSSERAVKLDKTASVPGAALLAQLTRSIISSEQAVGLWQSRRLLVPTWMMSWSGFFFLIMGLIWSRLSLVVQPGKVETLTLLLSLDILWAFKCFSTESPAIMAKQAGLSSRSPSSALLLSVIVSSVFSRTWNLFWSAMVPLFKFSFPFRFGFVWHWRSAALFEFLWGTVNSWIWLSPSLFSYMIIFNANFRESFSCSADDARVSRDAIFSFSSFISTSLLHNVSWSFSHLSVSKALYW